MVSAGQEAKLLEALRERLEPLFAKYDTLDYLVLLRAYGAQPRAYSTTIEACFNGTVEPIDFSDLEEMGRVHKRHFKEFVFYQDFQKLMQGIEHFSDPLADEVVVHRDQGQCILK